MNPGINVDQARFNMVEQQIRTWDVLDQDILDLLYLVRREEFVPEPYRALAFSDMEIPLGRDPASSERMWAPKVISTSARVSKTRGSRYVVKIRYSLKPSRAVPSGLTSPSASAR